MKTVDKLLISITTEHKDYVKASLPKKEFDILINLSISINNHFFITENQGRLLIKILRENQKKILDLAVEINEVISTPTWSKPFRQVEQVRKFYVGTDENKDSRLCIDMTFSQEIRKVLAELEKSLDHLTMTINGKKWTADYTEKNIVKLVEALTPLNFEIDEILKNHYFTIKSWSENEVKNQFVITNIEHKNFIKHIVDDLGTETPIDQNIINDRSIRYQYFTENPTNFGENLPEIIANRNKSRVWVDKNQHDVSEVINSLCQLKRLPMLIVFDSIVNNKYFENLQILSDALEKNGIFEKIGVYFRLPNDDTGKKFNQFIATKEYNYQLVGDTNVAVVMSGKLPKFFLKTDWKPMSVIAFDTRMGLRHGKTAVYSNCCDCIVEWSDEPPLIEQRIIKAWR